MAFNIWSIFFPKNKSKIHVLYGTTYQSIRYDPKNIKFGKGFTVAQSEHQEWLLLEWHYWDTINIRLAYGDSNFFLMYLLIYSFYTWLNHPLPPLLPVSPSQTLPLIISTEQKGKAPLGTHPSLGHQVIAGLSAPSPTEARQKSWAGERGSNGRQQRARNKADNRTYTMRTNLWRWHCETYLGCCDLSCKASSLHINQPCIF